MDALIQKTNELVKQKSMQGYLPIKGRIAYVVSCSQAYVKNDYTTHVQSIAKTFNNYELEILCFVRQGHPWDLDITSDIVPEIVIDKIRYIHFPWPANKKPKNEIECLQIASDRLEELFHIYRPEKVLATSDYAVGLPAWIAAQRLNLPFCSDVHSFGGGEGDTNELGSVDGLQLKTEVERDAFAVGKADEIITINELIKYRLIKCGIEPERIKLLSDSKDSVTLKKWFVDNKYNVRAVNDVGTPKIRVNKPAQEYNVLTIMDEFTEDCFRDEFNLIPASKQSWLNQLNNHDIDMFFAESAWRGNGATWNYCMSKISSKFGKPLLKLLEECRERRIPTVFWNKEDPINYNVFIETAKYFDYVFTTDASVIEKYKEDVGHDRVYLLKFAAQQKLHFPLIKGERNGRVAFAGSWHGKKYPVRASRLEMLFDYPLEKGCLDIYDRYSSLENADEGLCYPEKYRSCLLPAVPYNQIAEQVYKKYSVMLNVNSVEGSSSMLARRIYELCGCATPIVSSPAESIQGELKDIVGVAETKRGVEEKLNRILNDDIYALSIAARGVRFAHSGNTYKHRFKEILSKVTHYSYSGLERLPEITAICVSKRPWFALNVASMLKAQVGVRVKVIYVAHGEETDEKEIRHAFKNFKSFQFMRITGEDKVLADGLNLALDSCETDIVAKIDDDDHYGPNYLLDSYLALQYSEAALVGKTSFFCYVESTNDFALRFPGKHYRYYKRVQGGTLVWSRLRTANQKFCQVRQGTDSLFINELLDSGRKIYSLDPFNFVHVRYKSGNNHTWAISDEKFLESAKVLGQGLQLDVAYN